MYRVRSNGSSANIVSEALANATADMQVCGVQEAEADGAAEWRIYFEPGDVPADFAVTLPGRMAEFGLAGIEVDGPERVERENWHDNWRQYFQPADIGERLRVVPSWMKGEAGTDDRAAIFIEPGMAFGTGTHATTQLCLRLAERFVSKGERVLDIGTGSGILAIAAIKLGASGCVGTDLDDEVSENFAENLRLNEVQADAVQLVIGPLESAPAGPYDLIFCNMLMHEFMPLLHMLPERISESGVLLLSGLLTTEAEEVEQRVRELGLRVTDSVHAEKWTALIVRK